MWYKGVIIGIDPSGWFFAKGDYRHYERLKDAKERVEQILGKVGILWEIKGGTASRKS